MNNLQGLLLLLGATTGLTLEDVMKECVGSQAEMEQAAIDNIVKASDFSRGDKQ